MPRTSDLAMVSLLAMLGTGSVRADRAPEAATPVVIRLVDSNLLDGALLLRSEIAAGKILASAGVRLEWEQATRRRAATGCAATATIVVRFRASTPATHHPGAMGTSLPFAGDAAIVEVFYDRLKPSLNLMHYPHQLLGHVMAHEIGHQLLRTDAHADGGIMKAQWDFADFERMQTENLTFTPAHVTAIQSNLSAGCAAASCYSWLACASR